jgi:prepilin peptidase CpaA
MIAQILVLLILPALLAAAGGWDIASFRIPNFLSAAVIAAFILFSVALAVTPGFMGWHALAGMFGWHVLAGIAALVLGFALFALGYIGGGDAKLFAAVALWLGFANLLDYALIASLFGGALTLCILFLRRIELPAAAMRHGWIERLHDSRSGIPYGVALSAGAFIVLPYTDVFRLAGG